MTKVPQIENLLESAVEIMAVYCPENRAFIYLNPQGAKVFNVTTENGKCILEIEKFLPLETKEYFSQAFNNHFFGLIVNGFRYYLEIPEKGLTPFRWNAKFENGFWYCLLIDESGTVAIEQKLAAERLKSEGILESLPEAIFQINAIGECVFANASCEKILGIAVIDAIWRPILSIVANAIGFVPTALEEFLNSSLESEKKILKAFQIQTKCADAVTRNLEISGYFLHENAQSVASKIIVIRDVSVISRRNRDLLMQSRMAEMGRLSAGVAHELSNPLAIISVVSEIMKSELAEKEINPEMMRSNLDKIARGVARMDHTIQCMKILYGSQRGDMPTDSDLKSVIEAAISLLRPIFRKNSVAFNCDEIPDNIAVRLRSGTVVMALIQLLNNAWQASVGHTEEAVTLAWAVSEQEVTIKISDRGKGIPVEKSEDIFIPFYTTQGVGKGVGLGLSIARSVSEMHGGSLQLETCANPTVFVLTLKRYVNPDDDFTYIPTTAEQKNEDGYDFLTEMVLR